MKSFAAHARRANVNSRRLFLQGAAGVVVALPLLESLAPREARGEAPPPFRFAMFVRQGNGVQQGRFVDEPDRFWPKAFGPLTRNSMIADGDQATSVLADHAERLLLVSGVRYGYGGTGCEHAGGGLQCLTGRGADAPTGADALATGESIDWKIVRALDPAGTEPLNLRAGTKGYLDDVLSYRGSRDRVSAEGNPYNAYRRLFGLPDTTAAEAAKLALQRRSVNDLVRGRMQALLAKPGLAKADVDRLKVHFEAIRDLEIKLGCHLPVEEFAAVREFEGADESTLTNGANVVKLAKLHMDVMALAASCGLARAMTLQIGNGNDGAQYEVDGVTQERFHNISHRINVDSDEPIFEADVKHHKIDKLFAGLFKHLLDRLAAYDTPEGKLLDRGVAVWLNDLATGPPHGSDNLPFVCAGGAAGYLKTGAYVDARKGDGTSVTNNKFLSTIGAAVGVKNGAGQPLDDFGGPELEKGQIAQMLKA